MQHLVLQEDLRGEIRLLARSLLVKRSSSLLDRVARAALNREAHAFRIVVIAGVLVITVGLTRDSVCVRGVIGCKFFAERSARFFIRSGLADGAFFTDDSATVVHGSSARRQENQGEGKKQQTRHAPRITKLRVAVI